MQIFGNALVRRGEKAHNCAVDEHEMQAPEVVEQQRTSATKPAGETSDAVVTHSAQTALRAATQRSTDAFYGPSVVLGLQRTAGNAAVTALVQRSLAGNDGQQSTSSVLDVVGRGGGQPLDSELLAEMEERLGDDFSDVRIHTDSAAAKSAAGVSARAYTVGNEVVFGTDSPALDSAEGKRTLAHELTHVAQQRRGPVAGTPTGDGISISDPSDSFEQAAEANAERAMSPGGSTPASLAPGPLGSDGAMAGAVPSGPIAQRADHVDSADDVASADEAGRAVDQAGEEEVEPVQGLWVQRDTAGTDPTAAPAADPQAASDADQPTVDQFEALFDPDTVVSDMAQAGGDVDTGDASGGSDTATPTAQGLFLQRDPPAAAPSTPPAGASPTPPAAGAPAPAPTVQPGDAGKVLAALAEVPEFKVALTQVKAQAVTDWKQIVAGTTPAEKVIIFTVAGTIVGGGVAGAMTDKSSRSFMLDKVNNQKIDIPGLSGLSVTPKTANGSFQGGVVTVDVFKMFPKLQQAVPGVTN